MGKWTRRGAKLLGGLLAAGVGQRLYHGRPVGPPMARMGLNLSPNVVEFSGNGAYAKATKVGPFKSIRRATRYTGRGAYKKKLVKASVKQTSAGNWALLKAAVKAGVMGGVAGLVARGVVKYAPTPQQAYIGANRALESAVDNYDYFTGRSGFQLGNFQGRGAYRKRTRPLKKGPRRRGSKRSRVAPAVAEALAGEASKESRLTRFAKGVGSLAAGAALGYGGYKLMDKYRPYVPLSPALQQMEMNRVYDEVGNRALNRRTRIPLEDIAGIDWPSGNDGEWMPPYGISPTAIGQAVADPRNRLFDVRQ